MEEFDELLKTVTELSAQATTNATEYRSPRPPEYTMEQWLKIQRLSQKRAETATALLIAVRGMVETLTTYEQLDNQLTDVLN